MVALTREEIKSNLEEHDYKVNSLVETVNMLLDPPAEEPSNMIGLL